MARVRNSGVVLINVLIVLALTASVLVAMIRLSEIGILRSQTFGAAGQGLALLFAGESSAIVALRRDMIDAPETDHLQERWTSAAQADTAVSTGRFSVSIEDAQARFNLNGLPSGGIVGAEVLARIVRQLDLPDDVTARILARMAQPDPLGQIGDLGPEAGLSAVEIATLGRAVTVLPGRTDINLNTATEDLLVALSGDRLQAQRLSGIRRRQGFLTPADLALTGVIAPPGTGYRSAYFLVSVRAEVGDTVQGWQSLMQRRRGPGDRPDVVVIARTEIAAQPPALP